MGVKKVSNKAAVEGFRDVASPLKIKTEPTTTFDDEYVDGMS